MKQRSKFAATVLTAVAIGTAGCSSGGGGGSSSSGGGSGGGGSPPPSATAAIIQVSPSSVYDFGNVTGNNQPAPLQVTIRNVGNANLNVSSIAFPTQNQGFSPDFSSPSVKPCNSASPTVTPSDLCNFLVRFQPPATNGDYATSLQITSNGGTPVSLSLKGRRADIASITVRINQIDLLACPNNLTTAYVSVIDQGGFPVLGLAKDNFTFSQGTSTSFGAVASAQFIESAYKRIAISAVLDNSGSLVDEQPIAFADMNAGFAKLLSQLKGANGDIAEVIRFGTRYEIVQSFTSNTTLLTDAIVKPVSPPLGNLTLLYDTVFIATNQLADQAALLGSPPSSFRRAVVVATDGIDEGPQTGIPLSQNTVDTVIANANSKGVAIFAIGIGAKVNKVDLEKMASQTGGLYYQASESQNLATIYNQLAQLLFTNQYVVTFSRVTQPLGAASPVKLRANLSAAIGDEGQRAITACP